MLDLVAFTWHTPHGVVSASPFLAGPTAQACERTTAASYGGRMASKSAKLNILGTLPLFSDCSKRELGHVFKAGREIEVEAGTVIADQGQMGHEAFVILSGEVAVKRGGRKIGTLGAGDVVGELSLLDHGPRTATVVTTTPASLFVLGQQEFRSVIEHHPSISYKLLGALAQRIREFDRKYYG